MGTSEVICIPLFKSPGLLIRASCAPNLGSGFEIVVWLAATL